jgi:hypothetical protein
MAPLHPVKWLTPAIFRTLGANAEPVLGVCEDGSIGLFPKIRPGDYHSRLYKRDNQLHGRRC